MPRRFVNQLLDREQVDEIFQVAEKKLRPNRAGNLYLQVELCDRSGSISAMLWNATEENYHSIAEGDFVRVDGRAQLYQGEMQIIATRISKIGRDKVNLPDFMPHTPFEIDQLTSKLEQLLRSIQDPPLRSLIDCFLMDEEFMSKFTRAPAGIKNHHAYLGGLLEHVVTMMEAADRIVDLYPQLNRDLLLVGILLHDAGKIDELSYEHHFSYADRGQLIGHLVIAIELLNEKLQEAEKLSGESVPQDTVLRLKHMIVSHHGQYEFGSPKLPMTLEAVALWLLDNFDAKLHSFHQQMQDDPNVDSDWTLYNPKIGRKLFKSIEQPAPVDTPST